MGSVLENEKEITVLLEKRERARATASPQPMQQAQGSWNWEEQAGWDSGRSLLHSSSLDLRSFPHGLRPCSTPCRALGMVLGLSGPQRPHP